MVDIRLKTPFTSIISGASSSGKTFLLSRILKEKHYLFNKPPARTILFYNAHQKIYDEMLESKAIDEMHEGMKSLQEIETMVFPYKKNQGSCIIFDDSMHQVLDVIAKLFTTYSHHWNCSIFFITQNLFIQNQEYRTMSLNAQYYFVMGSARGAGQMATLGKQIMPFKTNFLLQSYRDSQKGKKYSYFLLDMKQGQADHLRFRTNILLSEPGPVVVYLPN